MDDAKRYDVRCNATRDARYYDIEVSSRVAKFKTISDDISRPSLAIALRVCTRLHLYNRTETLYIPLVNVFSVTWTN